MAVSRSLGNLIVRLVAEGLGGYKADMNAAADVTKDAAGKIEASTSKAGKAVQVMGGQIGASSAEIEGLSAVVAVAGLGVTALAATFAVAGYAASQGAKEAKAYELALILTGNAAGVTRGQMADMAAGVSKVVGTQGQASAALIAMVNTGAVASENLQKFTLTAIEMERTVGQKVGDTVKIFEQLGDAPVKASIKLNESLNYLTASTFAQIKAAEELGDIESAAAIAQDAYAVAANSRIAEVERNLGTLTKVWRGVGEAASWAWDRMLDIGRAETASAKLAGINKRIENAEKPFNPSAFGGNAEDRAQLSMLRAQAAALAGTVNQEQAGAKAVAENAASQKAKIGWMQTGDKYLTSEEKLTQTINRIRFDGNAAGASAVEIEKRINAEKEKGVKAGGGGSTKVSDYTRLAEAMAKTSTLAEQELAYGGKLAASERYRIENLSKIESLYAANKITLEERNRLLTMTTETVGKLYQVEKLAYEVDAIKKNNAEVDRQNEAMTKTLTGMVASNEQQRLNNETIGLTTEKLAELTLERYDAAIAEETLNLINLQSVDASAAEIANLERKIQLLKEQRNLTATGQSKTAYAGVKSTLMGDDKPATASYDPRELALIIGAETEKVTAYNATARAAIDAEQARQTAVIQGQIASGTATDKQLAAYDALIAKNEEMRAKMDVNFKVAGLDDMTTKLSSMSDTAGKLGDGFKGASKALGGFASGLKTISDAQKNQAKTGRDSTAEQIGGYGEMAGAAKEMFDKNSAGYEVMAAVEKAMFIAKFVMQAQEVIGNMTSAASTTAKVAVELPAELSLLAVKGASAVLNQGTGDPYTAFFRMAAMAAIVASVIAGAGGSGGGGGGGGTASGGGTATDGAGGANDYTGAGGINKHGQYNQTREVGGGDSGAAERDGQAAEDANNAAKALNELNLSMRVLKNGATALEQDLIDVRKAAQGAGRAQHDMATNGMGEAELKAYNYNAALENQIVVLMDVANGTKNASKNAKALADETTSLSIELMEASGDIAGARAMQRDVDTVGYTSGELAHYDYNAALQAQIDAMSAGSSAANDAAQAENDLAQKRYELANVINVLLGNSTQLEMDRKTELAGVTDTSVIALINLRNALEDIDSNIVNLIANADTAFATLQRAIKAQRELASVSLKASTDLFGALKSSLSGLNLDPSRANAQEQVAMFLAMAKAGGGLPSAVDIQPALKAISKPSEQLFSTFEDYQRDFLNTARDISDLSGLAETQVSEAQAQIDALDAIVANAQSQLDKLNDIDTSVQSVAGAVMGMATAFSAAEAAKAGADAARSAASAGVNLNYSAPVASSGGGGGYGGYGGGVAGLENIPGQTNKDIVSAYRAYYNRNPDEGGYETYSRIGYSGDKLMQAILGGSAGNPDGSDFQMARSRGYDPLNPTAKFLASIMNPSSGGAQAPQSYNSYDVGSNYIPNDQIAQIHKGEEITSRPYVDLQRASRDETNALMRRLVQSNEGLRAEVKKLQASSERGNENTQRTADTLSGRQSVPFLVQVAV